AADLLGGELLNVGRHRPLRTLLGLVADARPVAQRAIAVPRDRREVDEEVLASVVGGDEPVALLVAEPLHGAFCHSCLLRPFRCVRRRRGPPCTHSLDPGICPSTWRGNLANPPRGCPQTG